MDDLISRQAAIEAVLHHGEIENDYTDLYYDGYCDGVYDSADILKDMPSAQSERWIPCSKRLPEEDGYYLVTNSKWGAPWREITLWMTDGWSSNNEPIAWMPLPKPYEERREDA